MLDRRRTSRPLLKLLVELRLPASGRASQPVPARRGAGRAVRAREEARSCSPRCPTTTSRSARGSARRTPLNIVVLPVLFEGEVKAVIELASFYRFSEIHLAFLDQLTESHRRRAQHDRGQHAHRGAAQAVAVARRGAPERSSRSSPRRTSGSSSRRRRSRRPRSGSRRSRRSCSRPTRSSRRRRGCSQTQNVEVERKNREIEQAQGRARGEGASSSRSSSQVQVRVPRQHVARAAHAAEQPADPRQAARRQRGREPHRRSRSSSRRRSTPRAPTCSR